MPLMLIRVACAPSDHDDNHSRNRMEFAAEKLEDAISQALTWNADRTNHGSTPSELVLEQWDNDGKEWHPIDLVAVLLPEEDS